LNFRSGIHNSTFKIQHFVFSSSSSSSSLIPHPSPFLP
jgi:hypothetical protein